MARLLTIGLSAHWFIFWLFNGLDKIFKGQDFGIFVWKGKDRTNQFSGYLEGLAWPVELFQPLMMFLFVVEIFVALAFLRVIIKIVKHRSVRRFMPQEYLKLPILMSFVVFTCFSAWDVVVGDRAELWEHGTFIIALGTTWIIASFESVLDVIPQSQYNGPEKRSASMTDRRLPVEVPAGE